MSVKLYRKIRQRIRDEGLVVDSSIFLVRKMVDQIDFSRDLHILEIGSGKGAFTRQIASRMSDNSRLDICEINVQFNPYIEQISRSCQSKQITVFNHCITRLWMTPVQYDVILSSLPLKNFESKADNNAFLTRVLQGVERSLKEGGTYLQYQYFCSNKSNIETVFGKKVSKLSFVALNILPAFVYSITK